MFYFTIFSLTLSFANVKIDSPNPKVKVVQLSNLDFDTDGILLNEDFATAFCTETRNGVTYSITVGCFLCSPQRAAARCASVLSRRIDEVNPELIY